MMTPSGNKDGNVADPGQSPAALHMECLFFTSSDMPSLENKITNVNGIWKK